MTENSPQGADGTPPPDGRAEPARPVRRFAWWHSLQPLTRRAIRVGAAVLAALLVSMGFAVATASYTGSLGPHVAEYSTRLNGEVRVDMGPLGSLVIDSPAPANLGVYVRVHEIPDQLTADDADPIAGLMADVRSYEQFLTNPQATVDDAVRGLVQDAIGRCVVTMSVLLMGIALGRLAAHGVLREAFKSAWRQPGVPFLAPTLALMLVVLPLSDLTRSFGLEGRSSPVLAGTPLAEARITGRLATIVDHYGGMVVRAVEDNEQFYAELNTNLLEAYAADQAPLAPPERPAGNVAQGGEDGAEPDDAEQDGTQHGGTEQDDAEQDGAQQDGAEQDDAEQDGAQQDGAEQDDAEQDGAQQEAAEQDGTEQDGGGQDDQDADGGEPAPDEHATGAQVFSEPGSEYATFLMIADLHCNVGMAPVIATAAELSEADAILNAGDTVMSGTEVESFCVNAFADALPSASDLPVIVADGNHDSVLTGEQERDRGWTVLEGDAVEVAGVRILGDTDPTLTEIGTGTRPERDETVLQMGERLRDRACELQDEGDPVDILLIHSPHAGRQSLEAGCVPLNLSGHMHSQGGPWQLGWGAQYISSSTAGATLGQPTVGPLNAQAAMTVIRWDLTSGEPAHYRLIHADPDASVSVGPWVNFPDPPDEFVDPTAPRAPETEDPDGEVQEGDPSAPDQNLPEDEEAIREQEDS